MSVHWEGSHCQECEKVISEEEFRCEACGEVFCSEFCLYKHNERVVGGNHE